MAAAAVVGGGVVATNGYGSRAVGSVEGLLSMLEEEREELHVHAIVTLERVVDVHWAEVAGWVATIESFAEDESFPESKRASLLASRVFYHLGEMRDALNYALGAGELFDPSAGTEYAKTMLASGIDAYVAARQRFDGKRDSDDDGTAADDEDADADADDKVAGMDPRLEIIVNKMFAQCVADGDFQQAIGFAMESRRLDLLREAVRSAANPSAALEYALRVCNAVIVTRVVRHSVLRELVALFGEVPSPDHLSICQCHMFLDDPGSVASILEGLLRKSKADALAAYQVAFDLSDNELQSFLDKVKEHFPEIKPPAPPSAPVATETEAADAGEEGAGATAAAAAGAEDGADAMDTDAPAEAAATEPEVSAPAPTPPTVADDTEYDAEYAKRVNTLRSILSGEAAINLSLEFLFSNNHADLGILNAVKRNIETRNSVCHGAMVFVNAIAHAGTTVDTFLRENLEWLSKAVNWAKFSATAGLGVIHKGHISQSRALMAPYLPRNGVSGSSYSEGGALYALGLIHANHGSGIKDFLLESLRNTTNETTQHGACLGLGLAALGTDDELIYEALKDVMYTDSAVAGEAAGLSLGMLMVGKPTERTEEMLAYAHDTSHEKIIRGIAIGLAITVYALEEEADAMIEQMVRDQDQILRYGGMFAIGLAYRGTANNAAMRKLLHFAVSDVNDDVRRAAVLNLGFVLCSVPDQCPRTVALLAESYNPHVRYGAAMAVGISAAGTGLHEACALLEPLLSDAVDFVRQGALIAMSMVLVQQPESRLASFRKHLDKFIGDKHEDTMCKMGAIMAVGILDAGGRNMTLSLRSRSGFFRMNSVIGLALFVQYWFWYPLSYMLSLSVVPTAVICVNEDLKMPKMSVTSNAKASLFAYPAPISAESSKTETVTTKAVLSTAAAAAKKARAKQEAAKKNAETDAMMVDEETKATGEAPTDAAKGDTDATKAPEGDEKEAVDMDTETPKEESSKAAAEAEPSFTMLANPSRVVPAQEKFIKFEDARYKPARLRGGPRCTGIIVVEDTQPDKPVELISDKDEEEEKDDATTPAAGTAADGATTAAAGAVEQPEDNDDDDDDGAEPPAAFQNPY